MGAYALGTAFEMARLGAWARVVSGEEALGGSVSGWERVRAAAWRRSTVVERVVGLMLRWMECASIDSR